MSKKLHVLIEGGAVTAIYHERGDLPFEIHVVIDHPEGPFYEKHQSIPIPENVNDVEALADQHFHDLGGRWAEEIAENEEE